MYRAALLVALFIPTSVITSEWNVVQVQVRLRLTIGQSVHCGLELCVGYMTLLYAVVGPLRFQSSWGVYCNGKTGLLVSRWASYYNPE